MQFFDSTAIGQIISRLMSDKESIDSEIGFMIQICAFGVVQLIGIVSVVVSASPGIFIIFVILFSMFVSQFKKQIIVNTELKKMHTVAQAPVFSNISEVFNGASIIKSFQVEKKARKDFELNMDKQLVTALHLETSGIYLELKCEQYGALLALFTALTITLMRIADIKVLLDKDTMSLALSYVIIISNWVSSNIFAISKFMKGIASYERVLSWIDTKDLEKMTKKKTDPSPEVWPKSGRIEGRNLTARYRPELPRVLKGLDFVIEHKEKVGIVGRTGSGKSTLILSLLRILEQDKPETSDETKSQILIDGKVIGDLGLYTSRKAVTLIPQEPFLLSGTVRSNVDPFKRHTDQEIIAVLKNTNLYESLLHSSRKASTGPGNAQKSDQIDTKQKPEISDDVRLLDYAISSAGSNLSVG